MNLIKQIYKNGFIKSIDESCNYSKTKIKKSKNQDNIDMCLNCTSDKCNGNCDKIRKNKRW